MEIASPARPAAPCNLSLHFKLTISGASKPMFFGGGEPEDWRTELARKFKKKLDKRLATLETETDFDTYGAHARRPVTISASGHIKSWSYFSVPLTWGAFCEYHHETFEHADKKKCEALTLATLTGGTEPLGAQAEKKNVTGVDIVGIDYDKGGHTVASLAARCRELGYEALICESYSSGIAHQTLTWLTFDGDDGELQPTPFSEYVCTAFNVDPAKPETVTGEHAKRYLVEVEGYDADALGEVTIADRPLFNTTTDGEETTNEIMLRVQHDPLPKLRVFVLLEEPFERRQGENNDKYQARYERDCYLPVADAVGAGYDTTCKSLERRWFVRGRRPGGDPCEPVHVPGKPVVVEEQQQAMSKAETFKTFGEKSSNGFQLEYDLRGFQAADALVAMFPDKIVDKRSDVERPLVAIDCPFRSSHGSSKQGQQQLIVFNAEHKNQEPVVKCLSETCQRHKHSRSDYLRALFAETGFPTDERFWLGGFKQSALAPKKRKARVRPASEIEAKPTKWLCQDHLPAGVMTMLLGREGTAKSQFALHLVAGVVTGKAFARDVKWCPDARGKAIIISAEDPIDTVVIPRLMAAGVTGDDLCNVLILDGSVGVDEDGKEDGDLDAIMLDNARDLIEQVLAKHDGVKLVVIDTVNAVLGGDVDPNYNNQIRAKLRPLVMLAEKHDLAIILVHHMKKDVKGVDLAQMSAGSNAWVETTRSIWMVAALDRDRTETVECVVEQIKANLSRKGQRYSYRTEGRTVGRNNDIQTSCVVVDGRADRSVADILRGTGDADKPTLTTAMTYLKGELAQGWRLSDEIRGGAETLGISNATFTRARKKLGLVPKRRGFGPTAVYYLCLPEHADEPLPGDASPPLGTENADHVTD